MGNASSVAPPCELEGSLEPTAPAVISIKCLALRSNAEIHLSDDLNHVPVAPCAVMTRPIRVTALATDRCLIGGCSIEKFVPENRPASGKRIAAACHGKKPGDRRSGPGPSNESRVHHGSDRMIRKVFDGEPGSIAYSAAWLGLPRIAVRRAGHWSWPGRYIPPASGSPDLRHHQPEGPGPSPAWSRRSPFRASRQGGVVADGEARLVEETKGMQVPEEIGQCPNGAGAGLAIRPGTDAEPNVGPALALQERPSHSRGTLGKGAAPQDDGGEMNQLWEVGPHGKTP